jgi:hypothetical protein
MLPRELVEEFVSGVGAACLHVLVALADSCNGFLVVLPLPFKIIR